MVTHRPLSFVKGPEEIISRVREFESDGVPGVASLDQWKGLEQEGERQKGSLTKVSSLERSDHLS